MLMRIEPVPEGFQLLLPRALVEACGLAGEVTVSVREQTLVVEKKPRPVREGLQMEIGMLNHKGTKATKKSAGNDMNVSQLSAN